MISQSKSDKSILWEKMQNTICKACGDCCKYIDIPGEIKIPKTMDLINWLDYHNITILNTKDLRVHNKCIWLQIFNHPAKGKQFVCAIYPDRPDQCRRFTCEKIKSP